MAPRGAGATGGTGAGAGQETDREADREAALLHGTRLHLLLQHLPDAAPADRPALAAALLAAGEEPPPAAESAALLAEAAALLAAPDLRWLFQAEALAEVDVTAALPVPAQPSDLPPEPAPGAPAAAPEPLRLLGRIDRLLRRPDGSLLLVDFKSDAAPPAEAEGIPPGYLVQMGAYLAALEQIFPQTPLAAAILWTRSARLMPVPEAAARAALGAALGAAPGTRPGAGPGIARPPP